MLQQTIQEIPSQDLTIVMGDFNAKVGRDCMGGMGRSTGETWIWGGKLQRRQAAKLMPEQQPASNEHSVLPKEGKQEVDLGVTGQRT